MRRIDGVDVALALHPYDEVVRRFILAAKNGGRQDLLARFGRQLAGALAAEPALLPEGWLSMKPTVVWVPASRDRRRVRGYDQGRSLARAIGHSLGLAVRPLLARAGPDAQEGRNRAERLSGPEVRCRVPRSPRHLIVVDDVITTGASMHAVAASLRRSGAQSVISTAVASSEGSDGPRTSGETLARAPISGLW